MEIRTRSVGKRTVAVVAQEIRFEQIDAFLAEGTEAIARWASRHPDARGPQPTPDEPTMAIFHAELVPGGDPVLVEIAAVVGDNAVGEPGIDIRVEPSYEEAYVTVSKDDLDFPRIMDAYAAVTNWVCLNGRMLEDLPPREVYFADVRLASDSDLVCDVSVPYIPR